MQPVLFKNRDEFRSAGWTQAKRFGLLSIKAGVPISPKMPDQSALGWEIYEVDQIRA